MGTKTETQPIHEHDCDRCKYLDSIKHQGTDYDLYIHPSNEPYNVTVIARYGIDGEYASGLPFITTEGSPLQIAGTLAYKAGLLTDEILAKHGVAQKNGRFLHV